jgi:hypothetical protein
MDSSDDPGRLADEVTAGGRDEPSRFRSFLAAFVDALRLPADAHIVGEPVEILGLDYGGHSRQGLTARCVREGREYVVAVTDIELAPASPAGRLLAAYRSWCGLAPVVDAPAPRPPKAAAEDVPDDRPVELVVLVPKQSAARCRLLGSDRQITLRATRVWELIPGDIVTVEPRKRWTHARHPYLSGEVRGFRFDPRAAGLVPLRLEPRGASDPSGARGPEPRLRRPEEAGSQTVFEMEEALAEGGDMAMLEAVGACEVGAREHAQNVLADLLTRDLRCIAARELLGSMAFRALPREALRYYESGVLVADLSFPPVFRGVLPWPWPGNRPFLRCLHGSALCLWRLKRLDEALVALERLLSLDPDDHLGSRRILDAIERRQAWEKVGPELTGGAP